MDLAVLEMIRLLYPSHRAGLRNEHMIKSFEISTLQKEIAMLLSFNSCMHELQPRLIPQS